MSLSKMKPLPRFIVIASGVAVIVAAANFAIGKLPQKPVEPNPQPVVATTVPPESTAASAAPVVDPTAAAPAAEAPVLQPATPIDAGLANVLGGKK